MNERKRLFVDIEVSPNRGYFWQSGYKINLSYENIEKERAIICISYKWEGEKQINCITWNKKHCDKSTVKGIISVFGKADEIIGHNIDKFDMAWIRTRALFHDIPMPPKYMTVDTLKIARSKFRFNSNRLDYLAQYLGVGAKIKTEFGLWKEVMAGDEAALSAMVKYCNGDISILEKVYNKLRPHIEPKINYPALYRDDRAGCPECGSDDLVANGTRATLTGIIKRQYRCRGCGTYHMRTIPRDKSKAS